jgi:hypothetical protein
VLFLSQNTLLGTNFSRQCPEAENKIASVAWSFCNKALKMCGHIGSVTDQHKRLVQAVVHESGLLFSIDPNKEE